jgi:TonB family protein
MLFGCTLATAGLILWWFLDLRHRHTLTAEERAQAEGWFKDIAAKPYWVLIQRADDDLPEQSVTITQPVFADDGYGNVSITAAITLSPYAYDTGYGRFQAVVQRRYDDLGEPKEVEMVRDDPEYPMSLTWRIINRDSMSIVLDEHEADEARYAVVTAERFSELQEAFARSKRQELVRQVVAIAQGTGMVRVGSFISYACGDECAAAFSEERSGVQEVIYYVCNNNSFGEVQLSEGDLLGEGDFTNKAIVGQQFLIISKTVDLATSTSNASVPVIVGLLPFRSDMLSPELQQWLTVSANYDASMLSDGDAANSGVKAQFQSGAVVLAATAVDEMPRYPGGEAELFKYLGKSIRYPHAAQESGISGVVLVTFVVGSDGRIRDPKVLRGIGGGCDEEAIRVVKSMPAWVPGKQQGKSVIVQYNLPIRFSKR